MNSDNYNLDWAMRVLGVNLNMTAKEITQQYHNLCRTYHTDIPDNSSARSDAKMKDINIAYKIVTEYLKQNPGRQQSKSSSYYDNGETETKENQDDELWAEYEKAMYEYESAMNLYKSAMDCY